MKIISSYNQENHFLDSVKHVKKRLRKENEIKVKNEELRKIMKYDLNMSYRKVKNIAVAENS